MTTTRNGERKRNGQYGASFSAICECGKPLGEHTAEAPYTIDESGHLCGGFRKRNPLAAIPVGRTTVLNGHAVTRWSATSYEVDTWGRYTVDAAEAARLIAK